MLWTIAVALVILWLLGLVSGLTMGLFIHILWVIAIALLAVNLGQEIMINRKLRHIAQSSRKPDSNLGAYR
ncbi:MAG: lmo0937 family membrane protein [Deltaproteobacteria bacterium]|nr:lmo0937 family membrane protein [Deltaproteobacteria bacterium]